MDDDGADRCQARKLTSKRQLLIKIPIATTKDARLWQDSTFSWIWPARFAEQAWSGRSMIRDAKFMTMEESNGFLIEIHGGDIQSVRLRRVEVRCCDKWLLQLLSNHVTKLILDRLVKCNFSYVKKTSRWRWQFKSIIFNYKNLIVFNFIIFL